MATDQKSSGLADVYNRLGEVERSQVRFDGRLGHIEKDLSAVAGGVKELLSAQARQPDSLTWKTVIVTVVTLGACLGSLWVGFSFLLAASPVITDHGQRLRDLDHPDRGRIAVLERRIAKLEAALDAPPSVQLRARRPAAD